MTTRASFHVVDYCIFAGALCISVVIGLYHGLRRKQTPQSFLLGDRQLPILPTVLSLLTSFLSGVLLLGVPAEIYQRGLVYSAYMLIGAPVGLSIAIVVFFPVFFNCRPTSIYEYFQLRFGSVFLRCFSSSLFLIYNLAYMAVVLYAPSIALSGVNTNLPVWIFILTVGLICVSYTTLGGIKAVVWTDAFQGTLMFAGILTLLIKGTFDAGGIARVWRVSVENHRMDSIMNFDPNPFQYCTFWTAVFGGIPYWMSGYGLNQMAVQRYMALPGLKEARTVAILTIPAYFILVSSACLLGLVMFVYYIDCDPLSAKVVKSRDQLVIHFVLDVLGPYPGLPGLFLACLFSGTLSTLSSGINSMTAVVWEDFISNFSEAAASFDKRKVTIVMKSLSFGFGFIAIACAFLAGPVGGLISAANKALGSIVGPMVGLFILGVCVPCANKYGAIAGVIATVAATFWVCIGAIVLQPYKNFTLPLFVDNCTKVYNISMPQTTFGTATYEIPYSHGLKKLYTLSEVTFVCIGVVGVPLIGTIVSVLTRTLEGSVSSKESVVSGKEMVRSDLTIQHMCQKRVRKESETKENAAEHVDKESTI